MLYRLFPALFVLSFTTFLLGPLASEALAGTPAVATAPPVDAAHAVVSPVQGAERLDALLAAERFDELATITGDAVLKRRLSELRRARFMQQRLHAQYQPRHPVREAIDDRVTLLESEVVRRAAGAVEIAQSTQAQTVGPDDALARAREQLRAQKYALQADQSGVSHGESDDGSDDGSAGSGAL